MLILSEELIKCSLLTELGAKRLSCAHESYSMSPFCVLAKSNHGSFETLTNDGMPDDYRVVHSAIDKPNFLSLIHI